ncbi:MAG: acyl-CoA dehydrogenase [Frankia sp.]|nr:acyl-CoA dehydrogenase [Frankia sp.]
MAIAISEEHRELARTTRSLLSARDARGAGRALLEADDEALPAFWKELADLGLLGVHLPEEHRGGGSGLPELVVVLEEVGRAVAPGPVLPTVLASAVLAAKAGAEARARLLPWLAAGSTVGALGLGGDLTFDATAGTVSGSTGVVLGGALADVLVLAIAGGDDLVIVPTSAAGVTPEKPGSLDRSRRSARFRLDNVAVAESDRLAGARPYAQAVLRTLVAAEAVGVAYECLDAATGYAKVREQFGRVIGTFQAVKHHLANMLVAAELAAASVWDAARAADGPVDEFALAAAAAAALAVPAGVRNAELNIQLHGGIGYTWEHDAHLLYRRALTAKAVVAPAAAAADVTRLVAAGVARPAPTFDLPAEAEAARPEVRARVAEFAALEPDARRRALADSGYLQPHWPKPWGLAASPGLQLVIEQEFRAAGVKVPNLMITGWVVLTLIQHATPEQAARWVKAALYGDEIWCQLFSEPNAGSDAAAVRTKAERVEGGWIVNGQKVWTSEAHKCRYGLATVRTDPNAAKHAGITTMVIDMQAPGVQIRPLRTLTGDHYFNEVFLTDVFVPDSDVIGEPGKGWTVARATLGNERVSLGSDFGTGGAEQIVGVYQQHADRLGDGGAARLGSHLAEEFALRQLNVRRVARVLHGSGSGPGPEGNVTKLVQAEHHQRTATLFTELVGEDLALEDGLGNLAGRSLLGGRAMTIAGGTSEIARNQIAERILGLPRDPLIS